MNFDLSEEQQMIVDSVARFVADDSPVERFRKLRETELGWEKSVWRSMGERGWLGVAYPEPQGGFGGGFVDLAIILEQLGRELMPEPYIASVVLAGGLISRFGSAGQVESFLQPMIAGESSLALAYAERQSRYRLADCRMRAQKDGSGWKLDGEKVWVLNGHAADQIVVAARTAGEPLDANGISLFIVDGAAAGLSRLRVPGMDGQRSAVLRFEGVRVGPDRLLGEAGQGLPRLEWAIDRGAAAACACGIHRHPRQARGAHPARPVQPIVRHRRQGTWHP